MKALHGAAPTTSPAREPGIARDPAFLAASAPAEEEPMDLLSALACLQDWLHEVQRRGMGKVVGRASINLEAQATEGFCVGKAEGRPFFAVEADKVAWFRRLPWLRVAVRPDSLVLTFVAEPTNIDGNHWPSFALSFNLSDREHSNWVAFSRILELRTMLSVSALGMPDIDRQVLMTIDVSRLDRDVSAESLVADAANASGHTFRSVFR